MKIKELNADVLDYSRIISDRLSLYSKLFKEYMGVSSFGYAQIFFDNTAVYSINDFQNAQCMMKHALKSENTVFYQDIVSKRENMYVVTWPEIPNRPAMKQYCSLGYWNGIGVIQFHRDSTVILWFCSDLYNTEIQKFYTRNYNSFIKFSKYFIRENNDIMSIQHIDNQVRMPLVKNSISYVESDIKAQLKNEQLQIKKFFDSILKPSFNLSSQEYRCIEILSQGRTMKEAAGILNLSPRTVESYIENVKGKTGCNFKSQILDLFFDDRVTNI